MKRIVTICVFAILAFQANAQVHLGGQFSINFAKEHTDFSSGAVDDKERAYMVNLKPKLYWNLNEDMQVGGRIGFAFGRLTNGVVFEDKQIDQQNFVNRAIGWSVSPFYSYRVFNWKIVSVWAEANAFVGQYYNVKKQEKDPGEWKNQMEYGFQILPVVSFDLTPEWALQLHLGFLSLGWYGTRANYDDKVVTTSTWDLHKGGFAGILQGLADYGIGLVKTF